MNGQPKDLKNQTGVDLIAQERARQLLLGYDSEHDDEHAGYEIALAAVCYALQAVFPVVGGAGWIAKGLWPFDEGLPKTPCSERERIELLQASGALIAAEIDRLLRGNERGEVDVPDLAERSRDGS